MCIQLDASSLLDSPGQTPDPAPEPSPSLDGTEGWLEAISVQLTELRSLLLLSAGLLIFCSAATFARTRAK